jgi:tetrapyrrole methylase family protein/MazG family protein
VEECYEVIDAALNGGGGALCEELGDVLLHVVMNSKMAEIDGEFTLGDVITGVSRKMIGRHPHIFAPGTEASDVLTADDVIDAWDNIKKEEKGHKSNTDVLKSVPRAMPALVRAAKIMSKAAKTGVDAPPAGLSADVAVDNLERLVAALRDAGKSGGDKSAAILGEILLTLAAFSVKLQINAEFALTNAIEQFINRFEYGEKESVLLE